MSNEVLFSMANTIVLPAWITLIFFPKKKFKIWVVFGVILLLAITYAFLVFTGFGNMDFNSFSTLAGVMSLFTDETGVLAGWLHYLAFDLLAGYWMVNDAINKDIKHGWVIPCLLLCFMFGPLGFLFYFIIRSINTKRS